MVYQGFVEDYEVLPRKDTVKTLSGGERFLWRQRDSKSGAFNLLRREEISEKIAEYSRQGDPWAGSR